MEDLATYRCTSLHISTPTVPANLPTYLPLYLLPTYVPTHLHVPGGGGSCVAGGEGSLQGLEALRLGPLREALHAREEVERHEFVAVHVHEEIHARRVHLPEHRVHLVNQGMRGWMGGWVDACMDGCMDGKMDE